MNRSLGEILKYFESFNFDKYTNNKLLVYFDTDDVFVGTINDIRGYRFMDLDRMVKSITLRNHQFSIDLV